jgi:AraC-like DNA-binding protein
MRSEDSPVREERLMLNGGRLHPWTAPNRLRVVEIAEAFVRDHLCIPIQIKHLCRVTGVSERTLRNAFSAVRGMSPKRFMLRARLEAARLALRSRHGQATVATIATDYGFYELGRFACLYKAVYGEYPSHTLYAFDEDGETTAKNGCALRVSSPSGARRSVSKRGARVASHGLTPAERVAQ